VPELPEVETVRCGLAPRLEGKTLVKAKAFRPDIRSLTLKEGQNIY
jgi:formamidopyrimidine-DNA glycosylase